MANFRFEGRRIAYTSYGEGPHVTVLLPGLLLSQRMSEPLARALAARGNCVVTMDPLGHGQSDRPRETWEYSMTAFAHQTVALLDHLELEQAVVGGTSLGANITLEMALLAPERLRGMVLEMPVLDGAILAAGAAFTPLLFALRFGESAMRALAGVARRIPRAPLPFLTQIGLDWISQDPGPSASVLAGLLYGRVAPDHNQRAHLPDPGAGHRPPARPAAPTFGRRHARLRAPQRPADRCHVHPRAARQARAAHAQDRRLRRRVLGGTRQAATAAALFG